MQGRQYPHLDVPRSRSFPALRVIAIMMLVLILVCSGLVTYVAYNFRHWAAGFARGPLMTLVDEIDLAAEQKLSIKQNLNRVADEFQQGRMSYTQFRAILQKLGSGAFFELLTVEAMQHQYSLAHPQTDEARRETLLMFDRFERGMVEGTIPRDQVRSVLSKARDSDQRHPDGSPKEVTEAELQPFIDTMRRAVEAASIPAEPFEPDFATEIDKVVNAVLGTPVDVPTSAPVSGPANAPFIAPLSAPTSSPEAR